MADKVIDSLAKNSIILAQYQAFGRQLLSSMPWAVFDARAWYMAGYENSREITPEFANF